MVHLSSSKIAVLRWLLRLILQFAWGINTLEGARGILINPSFATSYLPSTLHLQSGNPIFVLLSSHLNCINLLKKLQAVLDVHIEILAVAGEDGVTRWLD